MLRRYPHRPAGVAAAIIFGLVALVLGYALGFEVRDVSPFIVAPLAGVISAVAAFTVYASESDRRPPIMWQAGLADGIITGITSGVTVALLIELISGHAGTATGPAPGKVLEGLGAGALLGIVAGSVLGILVVAIGGPSRMTRPSAARPVRRRKRSKQRATGKRR